MRDSDQFSASSGCSLFDSPIGPIGLAWSERGLTRLQLPERDRASTEARLRRGAEWGALSAPSPKIASVVEELQRYLRGERVDFLSIALDLSGVSTFHRTVYDLARGVPWGQTSTYGALARRANLQGAARAVGQALGRNPIAIVIPCHRILASGRAVGGFSAFGGRTTKMRLLALEDVHLADDAPLLPGIFQHDAAHEPT
jgi:methylated-DNA-[protein]-cysteine S-methyltransferase